MFEAQYNELALAVDLIAERIRALGFPAPGTYKEFIALASIKETYGTPKAEDMIRSAAGWQRSCGTHRPCGVPSDRQSQ